LGGGYARNECCVERVYEEALDVARVSGRVQAVRVEEVAAKVVDEACHFGTSGYRELGRASGTVGVVSGMIMGDVGNWTHLVC
jgi:hypothetical protein